MALVHCDRHLVLADSPTTGAIYWDRSTIRHELNEECFLLRLFSIFIAITTLTSFLRFIFFRSKIKITRLKHLRQFKGLFARLVAHPLVAIFLLSDIASFFNKDKVKSSKDLVCTHTFVAFVTNVLNALSIAYNYGDMQFVCIAANVKA